jgi:excisionase family DNA binding protein
MSSDVDNSLMDIRAVSLLTGISVGSLYHWISQQRIPVIRFSARCVRFRRSDIEAWIAEKLILPADNNMPMPRVEKEQQVRPRQAANTKGRAAQQEKGKSESQD